MDDLSKKSRAIVVPQSMLVFGTKKREDKSTDRRWRAENTRFGISQTTRSIPPFKSSVYHPPFKNFAPAQDPSPTTNTQSRHSLTHFTATASPKYYYPKSENGSHTVGSPLEATGTEGSFKEKLGDAPVVD